MSSGVYKYMRVQPSLYPNSMEIRMMVSYTLFVYILRGASSLLVLTYRVMRRPQDVERVTGHSPRFFCIYMQSTTQRPSLGEGGGRRGG